MALFRQGLQMFGNQTDGLISNDLLEVSEDLAHPLQARCDKRVPGIHCIPIERRACLLICLLNWTLVVCDS